MSLDLCTTCHFGRLMLWSSQGADRMCWHMPWDICRQCSGLGVVATLILHPLCALVHFQQAGGWVVYPWSGVVNQAFSLEFGDLGSNSDSKFDQ